MGYIIVFIGAGIGGAARHGLNLLVPRLLGSDFPAHTFIINVLGSFLMGLVAEYFALKGYLPQQSRLFLATGIIGGFTTFSTYALDAVLLYQRGQWLWCMLYTVGSVVASIAALFAGLAIIRQLVAVP